MFTLKCSLVINPGRLKFFVYIVPPDNIWALYLSNHSINYIFKTVAANCIVLITLVRLETKLFWQSTEFNFLCDFKFSLKRSFTSNHRYFTSTVKITSVLKYNCFEVMCCYTIINIDVGLIICRKADRVSVC